MNIEFTCPQCRQKVECDETFGGHVAQCPHCGKGIVVPREKTRLIGRKNDGGNGSPRHLLTDGSNPSQMSLRNYGEHPIYAETSSTNDFVPVQKVPEWKYFVAWLAYSTAGLMASVIVGGLLGLVLGIAGLGIDRIVGICQAVGLLLSMPIGYFAFRYIAMTIVFYRTQQNVEMDIECPNCGMPYKVGKKDIGQPFSCGKCGTRFTVGN